jgi:ABC-2 type transport system permease protein
MTSALVALTLRALLNRRRTLLLALLGVLLVAVAVLFRIGEPSADTQLEVTRSLLSQFGIGVLVPLVAVIVGTSALGAELEDGTIVYLLARPVPRWRIAMVKLLVAWVVTCILVAPAILVAGIIGYGDIPLALGFALASVIGALEYTAIFVALSVVTSRALIVGLAYVVVWEGFIAGLFAGTRTFSVRQHTLAIAEELGGRAASAVGEIDLLTAVLVGTVVTIGAAVIAVRQLERVELRGETS